MVVGPQAYHRLPAMIAEAARGGRPVDTDMPATAKFDALPARRRANPSAFLTIQEGCDKFCTYCVVPYTRGAEISRAVGRSRRRSAPAGRRRRSRDRPARPECERLERRSAGIRRPHPRPRPDRWPRADPLHDKPPDGHERRAHRRACRGAGADALPTPAGAVGKQPHPESDEPQPHRRNISRHSREDARRASGYRLVGRFHRRLSR